MKNTMTCDRCGEPKESNHTCLGNSCQREVVMAHRYDNETPAPVSPMPTERLLIEALMGMVTQYCFSHRNPPDWISLYSPGAGAIFTDHRVEQIPRDQVAISILTDLGYMKKVKGKLYAFTGKEREWK